jgi:NAD(P)-dependent dehydrogenase (short-subunit alcohol dehydrogenase family)
MTMSPSAVSRETGKPSLTVNSNQQPPTKHQLIKPTMKTTTSFENQVAIITGGGTGIGRAAAQALLQRGAKVVINGRRAAVLEQTAKELNPSGKFIAISAGDISNPATAQALVQTAEDRFGGVDILLNNAGWFSPTPFLDHTEALYDRFVDVILKGRFFAAQAAVKAMQKRGGGAIVNTGSMWAFEAVGATPASAYSAAYAGVHMLTKSIALEHAKDGIRCNAVAPAVVATPAYDTFIPKEKQAEVLAGFNAFHPLGRIGQDSDVVPAILFLASKEASWITGTVLPIDGGVLAGR